MYFLLALLAFLVLVWCLKRWKDLHVLQNLGYPCPPVNFFTGNIVELFSGDGGITVQQKWMDEVAEPLGSSGKIMGWYRGPRPLIYCSNPEFLKQVLIKRSDVFVDKEVMDESDSIPHLILLKDSMWKRVRSTLTPTFSAAKMKKMAGVMNKSIDILLEVIGRRADKNQDADVCQLYQALTLDIIGQCTLGMKVDCQRDEEDKLLKMVKYTMNNQVDVITLLASLFPAFETFVAWLFKGGRKKANQVIMDECQEVIEKRRNIQYNEDETPIDSLQLMLDAAGGQNGKHRKLSDEEIVANAFVFLMGGYETTATFLTFTTYLLAVHPEIQSRVFQELEEVFGPYHQELSSDILMEKFNELPYLSQVMNESLRMYPPIPLQYGRRATKSQEIMGKYIPKGTGIMVPIWHMHHDPDLFPDPWTFNPERFAPENKSNIADMSFMPFGDGPRKCIGWRFATQGTKLTLIRLFRQFEVRLSPVGATQHPIKYFNKGMSLAPEGESVFLRPIRRQKKTQ